MAVYFDLKNEIPEEVTVLSAKFRIYRYDTWEKTHRVDGWYAAYKITNSSWVSQVTSTTYLKPWNKKGGDYTGEGADTIYNADTTGWFDFEITSHVQDFVNDPSKNYGVMFSVAMDNPNHLYLNSDPRIDTVAQMGKFHSMKAEDVSLRPQLVITYTTDPTDLKQISYIHNGHIFIKNVSEKLQVFIPFKGNHHLRVISLQGREIAGINNVTGNRWYQIPGHFSKGIQVIHVIIGNKTIVKKMIMYGNNHLKGGLR